MQQLIPSGGLRVNNPTRYRCLACCATPATDAARRATSKGRRPTASWYLPLTEMLRRESTMVNRQWSAPPRPQAPAPSAPAAPVPPNSVAPWW